MWIYDERKSAGYVPKIWSDVNCFEKYFDYLWLLLLHQNACLGILSHSHQQPWDVQREYAVDSG